MLTSAHLTVSIHLCKAHVDYWKQSFNCSLDVTKYSSTFEYQFDRKQTCGSNEDVVWTVVVIKINPPCTHTKEKIGKLINRLFSNFTT